MELLEKKTITVQVIVNAPINSVWKCWNTPEDITKCYNASDDWHTPKTVNDFSIGQSFNYRMEAKNGSLGFHFFGTYMKIIENEQIDCTLGDGRKLKIVFSDLGKSTEILESFEAETTNSIELQRGGWQAILNNFKKYVESKH